MGTSRRSRPEKDNEPDFTEFFRVTFPRAIAVAQRITGDHGAAEDAALDALAKAHFRWDRIGRAPWRDAWVYRVAINESIRRLPRRVPAMVAWSAEDHGDEVALRQTMTAALRRLPKRQCEVIVLRYLLGLSETQVAEALHLSHGTVKTHLRRGISSLRATVGRDLKEEHLVRLA
jgi:RNA polymerase sigma-70 factor (sigma-E family)